VEEARTAQSVMQSLLQTMNVPLPNRKKRDENEDWTADEIADKIRAATGEIRNGGLQYSKNPSQ